jgi:hypothetical protein
MKPQERSAREPKARDIETPNRKKPYIKPSFRFERVFETTALSCGKINQSQAACHLNRKNS